MNILNMINDEEKKLFNDWNSAKAEKNFDLADEYRAKLIELGLM